MAEKPHVNRSNCTPASGSNDVTELPITIKGATDSIRAAVRARPFVISLHYRNQDAMVVVNIESVQ